MSVSGHASGRSAKPFFIHAEGELLISENGRIKYGADIQIDLGVASFEQITQFDKIKQDL